MSIRQLLAELHSWQWLAILIARVAVGLLFFLAGAGKLFLVERREQMRATLEKAHIPLPAVNLWFVSSVEFVFGLLLVFGALTPITCLMLGAIMLVALITTKIPQIAASGPIAWLGQVLYLPEVLYLIILLWIFLSGPGLLSVDHLFL